MRPMRLAVVVGLVLCGAAAPHVLRTARADEDPKPAPAPSASDLLEQTDRRKVVSIKLPRSWKALGGEEADPNSLAGWGGFFGEPEKSPNGFCVLYPESRYMRATLARAMLLPQMGTLRDGSLKQGPGWAQGCITTQQGHAIWLRFVERGGRLYYARFIAGAMAYDEVHAQVEQILDTFAATGDMPAPAMASGAATKKTGEYDVQTDAEADRAKSVEKMTQLLAAGRDVLAKALPKPFDASRPSAWAYQNGQKFEDRAKTVFGSPPEMAAFNPVDRCAMVKLLAETRDQYAGELSHAGAAQYVWQYFGGTPPVWLDVGLSVYGQVLGAAGGKGKLPPDTVSKAKAAVAAGKRRLDQWFDVAGWNEVTDNDQGVNELLAWQVYFRTGRGANKYKKQYTGYIQALREGADPAAARKAFDGVNFDEMLQDFKSWAADLK